MDGTVARAVLLLAAFWGIVGIGAWLATPSSTAHELVRAGQLRRTVRWMRSIWVRTFLWWASWPHMIDHVSGVHGASVNPTPSEEVWREGEATIRRFHGARTRGDPVLLVHALVTHPWILDLAPGRSLVEALVEAGFDVFLLDWGDAGATESRRGITEYINTLLRAEDEVLAAAGAKRLHLAGYCSGATLCIARLGGWVNENVASFAAIAPPFDLAVPSGMGRMMSHHLLKPVLLLDESGCVPAAFIRESFHALRPQALRTVIRAFRRRRDAAFRATYDPLARWAYEQRRIPGALFFDLVEMYRTNALYERQLEIAGRHIDLTQIRTRMLIALATRDHIVPGASSQALETLLPRTELLVCPSGHVSMLSGNGGREVLWPGLSDFFGRSDRTSTRPRTAHAQPTGRAKKSTPDPG